jgi:hypothetical protein
MAEQAFEFGGEYRVRTTFQAMRDSFVQDECVVYCSSAWSRYDGITGYFFYDPRTGHLRLWDVFDEDAPRVREIATAYFECVGGWMQPPGYHLPDAPPLEQKTEGIQSPIMEPLLEYMQHLVEGADGIENWFLWFRDNAPTFAQCLKRAEFLRYKFSPVAESLRMLVARGIDVHPSLRYGWLDCR